MTLPTSPWKVLLLEDNSADADLLRELLEPPHWLITHVELLGEALDQLKSESFHIVLADLSLPDAFHLESVIQLHRHHPHLPLIVLTSLDDECMGSQALRYGAQDYLVKGQIDYSLLRRAIRYSIERAEAQQTIRQQAAAMAAATEGIAVLDANLRFLSVNQSLATIYGSSQADQILGQAWLDFYPEAERQRLQPLIDVALTQQGSWQGEATCLTELEIQAFHSTQGFASNLPPQQSLYQEISLSTFNGNSYICVIRDVTGRKLEAEKLQQSEAKFRQMAESIKDVFYLQSQDLKTLLYINPACEQIYGYDSQVITQSRTGLIQFVHPDDRKQVRRALKGFLKTRDPFTQEYRIIQASQAIRWVSHRAYFVTPHSGQPLRVAGIIEDVTDRKQTELELQRNLDKERELNELKSRFITTICHEYRTPLTSILSSAEILENYPTKLTLERQTLHLRRIQSSVKHLATLVEDVLILGKAETRKLRLNPTSIEAIQFCQDVIEDIQLSKGYTAQRLSLISQQSAISIRADPDVLRQILTNLLTNADKYSDPQTPIYLTVEIEDDRLLIKVTDHGIGIPLADQSHIFEAFYRSDQVNSIPGTGLGLSIVKQLVEAQKGVIALESQPGVGSTFTVTLPMLGLTQDHSSHQLTA